MQPTFMTGLIINKVRHLQYVDIPLSETQRKHLILTGKNGSGKTSVLEYLVNYLEALLLNYGKQDLQPIPGSDLFLNGVVRLKPWFHTDFFDDVTSFYYPYTRGNYIFAYYSDHRTLEISEPYSIEKIVFQKKNIEKNETQKIYSFTDHPGRGFVAYLRRLKAMQTDAKISGESQIAQEFQNWFDSFEEILRDMYEDPSLRLEYNANTFEFIIRTDGREPFGFDTMSRGYSAVFDIICDLMMRMGGSDYSKEGLVLIDEIETHLHVDLQKKIMPALTKLFPNIQFVITTHSPFVLNSLDNAVVYDLEKRILVKNGLTNLPYQGIVEGYFDSDTLSTELREKFERYKTLVAKVDPSDRDYAEMSELELYLDEVPDYLALDFATEYARLKLEANS